MPSGSGKVSPPSSIDRAKGHKNSKKIKLKDSSLTIEQVTERKKDTALGSQTKLKVKDKIVYPGHGVGTIESIVERKIGDITAKFYSVHLENSDLRLFIPCESAQVKTLRKIIGPVEVKTIFEMLKKRKKSKTDLESWNRRVREYLEIVKNCDVFELASLLSEFKAIMKAKALSFGEKRIFDTAKNLLATELSLALGKPVGAISHELDKMLGVSA
jgi:CarD family transcriptional regulator